MANHQNEELRYSRIYKLLEWKRYNEALTEAKALISEAPDDPNAYAVLAQVSLRMEQYKDAEHWSGEALRRDPESRIGWFVRSVTKYEMSDWKSLDASLDEAQRIDPEEPFYCFLRANAMNRRSQFAGAKEQLLTALALDPDNPLFMATLSYTEALLGNTESSRELARKALRLEVESDHVYLYLGWAAEHRNDYDEHLEMLSNAIKLDPSNKQIREEYLDALQKNYALYRLFLAPVKWFQRMKPWQILLIWIGIAIVFRPFIFIFLILYVATHWITKLLVHIKVFGWRRRM